MGTSLLLGEFAGMRKKTKGRKTMKSATPRAFEPVNKLADVERTAVYLPKPTQEPIDYEKLSRDLMQRFSKTLAELAK